MKESEIAQYICDTYLGIVPIAAWGETSFFYNPGRALPRGVYFATLKAKDGENDKASGLHRPEVFRLNIGISKASYRALFGPPPTRPPAGGIVQTGHSFTELNALTPHPVYGWMSWVSVLNPSEDMFATVKPLLAEAYAIAAAKFAKRIGSADVWR
jgi:hypothetical protein